MTATAIFVCGLCKMAPVVPPAPAGVPPLVPPGSLEDLSIQKIVQTLLEPRFYRRVRFDEDSPTFVPIDKSFVLDKAQDKVDADLDAARSALAQAEAAAAEASVRLQQAEARVSKDVQAYEVALERMRPVGTDVEVCASRDMTDAERVSCEEYMPKVAVTHAEVYFEDDYENDVYNMLKYYAIVHIEDAPGQEYLKDMIFNQSRYHPVPQQLASDHWFAGAGDYDVTDIDNQLRTLGYNATSLKLQLQNDVEQVFRDMFPTDSEINIHRELTLWEWSGDAKR